MACAVINNLVNVYYCLCSLTMLCNSNEINLSIDILSSFWIILAGKKQTSKKESKRTNKTNKLALYIAVGNAIIDSERAVWSTL